MLDILNKTLILTALLLFSITSCTIEEKSNSNLAPQEEGFVSLDITSILQDYNSDATKAGFVEPGYKLTYESEKVIKNLYVFIFDNKDTLESIAFYDSTVIGKIAINGKINLPDKIRVQASEKKTICIVGNASKQTRYYLENSYKMVIGKSKLENLRKNWLCISDYSDNDGYNRDKFAASLKPMVFFANEEPTLLLPMYGELEFRAMRENKNTEELKITVPLKRSVTRFDILLSKDVNNNNEYIIDSLTNMKCRICYCSYIGYEDYRYGSSNINKLWKEEPKTIITNGVGVLDQDKRIFSFYALDAEYVHNQWIANDDTIKIKNILKNGERAKDLNILASEWVGYSLGRNTVCIVDCTLHTNDSISVNLKSEDWEDVNLPLGLHKDGLFVGRDEVELYATWPDEKCKKLQEYSDKAYRDFVSHHIRQRNANQRTIPLVNNNDTLSFLGIEYKGKKIEPITDSITYAPSASDYYYNSAGYYYRLFYSIYELEDSICIAYCSNDNIMKLYRTKNKGFGSAKAQVADTITSVTIHYNNFSYSNILGEYGMANEYYFSDVRENYTMIGIAFDRYNSTSYGYTSHRKRNIVSYVFPSDETWGKETRRPVQEEIEFTFKFRADNINKKIRYKILPFSSALVDLKPIYEEWVGHEW